VAILRESMSAQTFSTNLAEENVRTWEEEGNKSLE
jgi:hypothetical protein